MYQIGPLVWQTTARVSYKPESMSNTRIDQPPVSHPAPVRFMSLRELRGERTGAHAPAGPRPRRLMLRTVRA